MLSNLHMYCDVYKLSPTLGRDIGVMGYCIILGAPFTILATLL